MKIAIVGTGYVGLSNAMLLAQHNEVVAVDINPEKVAKLNLKQSPIEDSEIEDFLKNKTLNFKATLDKEEAYIDSDYIVVATPTDYDPTTNYFNTESIESVVRDVQVINPTAVIVIRSTVPVGYTAKLNQKNVIFSPEFLREGTALQDSLLPDRIVIGVKEAWAEKLLRLLYEPITNQGVPLLTVDIPTAELVKVAANSFLATKISFINAMAEIAEVAGADAVKLSEAIGLDERIGNKFLKSGIGFGGGCLPKDIRGFVARAEELGVGQAVGFLKEVEAINLRRRSRVIELAQEELGDLTGRRVTILGAAFKPETDDIRDSPAMAVAEQFWMAGAKVVIHDPKALDNVRRVYPQLETEDNLHASVRGSELVVLTTEWKQYRTVDPLLLGQHVTNRLIIDGRNALDVPTWQEANWQIIALGRNLDRIPALV